MVREEMKIHALATAFTHEDQIKLVKSHARPEGRAAPVQGARRGPRALRRVRPRAHRRRIAERAANGRAKGQLVGCAAEVHDVERAAAMARGEALTERGQEAVRLGEQLAHAAAHARDSERRARQVQEAKEFLRL